MFPEVQWGVSPSWGSLPKKPWATYRAWGASVRRAAREPGPGAGEESSAGGRTQQLGERGDRGHRSGGAFQVRHVGFCALFNTSAKMFL